MYCTTHTHTSNICTYLQYSIGVVVARVRTAFNNATRFRFADVRLRCTLHIASHNETIFCCCKALKCATQAYFNNNKCQFHWIQFCAKSQLPCNPMLCNQASDSFSFASHCHYSQSHFPFACNHMCTQNGSMFIAILLQNPFASGILLFFLHICN